MIKPRFISFEGGEGSGKSTQIKLLAKKLAKYGDVVTTREPGGTIEAEIIRNLLVKGKKNKWSGVVETLLLYAARKDHIDKVIVPSLKKNKWVLCDRFKESTIVYQGYGKNVDVNLIKKLDKLITDNLTPSLTFILDIDPKIGLGQFEVLGGAIQPYVQTAMAHRRLDLLQLLFKSRTPL